MASSSSLPPSSSDHPNHYTYEVFLSFRGEDTRYGFTDHLHSALCQRGIETFRDDDKLRKGEDISQELLKAIEESRVSIIVFSQTYASSRWCLDELLKILECRKSTGQDVRAVFYKVDPSDVRHQTGPFGEGFATHDQCKYQDKVQKWKAALKEAADLAGWPFKNDEYETKFIDNIVGELLAGVVNPSCDLHVTEHPIGIESFSQEVFKHLHVEDNNIVHMVGIWGPGGIGKTTIAKAVFNSIRHRFACSCFLADVRSNSNDLAKLQKRLLVDVLGDSTLEVSSVDQGVSFIKTRMRHKKTLIILDDVSHSSQLQKLVPSPECFGPGSRVLITTRDKHLLTAHEVDEVYQVKMLKDHQALKLFSLSAFKRIRPPDDFLELAQRAIRYAQGLPLALIVLGSHLFRRSREEWEAILDSSKREDPYIEIRDMLKISYHALGVDLKGYFLDIACFFKGKPVEKVKPILEACYDHKSANAFLAQLQEKALIRIDGYVIWMHDLIEEMAKDIVYQESPDEPGKRSRLWSVQDLNDVLTNNTGTSKLIGIQAHSASIMSLTTKSFSTMKKLRYFSMGREKMNYKSFSGNINYLSDQLRWLEWPNCPLKCFPTDFHAKKLGYLSIPKSSRITHLWAGRKCFPQLTYMDLSDCESLSILPDFSGIPNLKKLDLSHCRRLVKVPDSLGFLAKLVNLDVTGCYDLRSFPRIINWKSLGSISTGRDCRLDQFPEVGEEMGSLRSLYLAGGVCSEELPPSISNLIGLEEWDLYDCPHLTTLPHTISQLCNLKRLTVGSCPELAAFPVIPIKMNSLRQLSLYGTGIRELDESIGNLIGLEKLVLWGCKNLRALPSSIYGWQNLEELKLYDCSNLVRFPTNSNSLNGNGCSLSLPKLKTLSIIRCGLSDYDFLTTLDCCETLRSLDLSGNEFVSLPGLTKFVELRSLDLNCCNKIRELPELPRNVIVDVWGCKSLDLRGRVADN